MARGFSSIYHFSLVLVRLQEWVGEVKDKVPQPPREQTSKRRSVRPRRFYARTFRRVESDGLSAVSSRGRSGVTVRAVEIGGLTPSLIHWPTAAKTIRVVSNPATAPASRPHNPMVTTHATMKTGVASSRIAIAGITLRPDRKGT